MALQMAQVVAQFLQFFSCCKDLNKRPNFGFISGLQAWKKLQKATTDIHEVFRKILEKVIPAFLRFWNDFHSLRTFARLNCIGSFVMLKLQFEGGPRVKSHGFRISFIQVSLNENFNEAHTHTQQQQNNLVGVHWRILTEGSHKGRWELVGGRQTPWICSSPVLFSMLFPFFLKGIHCQCVLVWAGSNKWWWDLNPCAFHPVCVHPRMIGGQQRNSDCHTLHCLFLQTFTPEFVWDFYNDRQ